MKLLVLFFVLSVRLCYAIDGYAQSTYFTLELNNKTVKEVFKAIEKNSEYVVFYYDGVVDVNRKVTIQAENKTVDQGTVSLRRPDMVQSTQDRSVDI
mgnify:CR=1 FL=1